MFKKILLAGACGLVFAGCEKIDGSTSDNTATDQTPSVEVIDVPAVEVAQLPEVSALDACKFATEIKVRDITAGTNMVVTSEGANEYKFDLTTADGVTPVTCLYNSNGVTKLTVGDSNAKAEIIRPVIVENDVFLPIVDLPHIRGSKISDDGSLISFYTIFRTVTPSENACLYVTYKADAGNRDSIFLSFNGEPFVDNALPITEDEKATTSFEMPSDSDVSTVRVTNRELPDIYGFEVKSCE